MSLLHILILSLVQGITEFLPISSSGHLILVWEGLARFSELPPGQSESERLILDIAVHVGTLGAVCAYFWRDVTRMVGGLGRLLLGQNTPGARLTLHILVATIPVLVAGYLLKDTVETVLRDGRIVAWMTIVFGIVLYLADRSGMTVRRIEHMNIGAAVAIGLAQVLALVPGTSRSGITMTAARILGFERAEAARFSLLLSIPTILGAGTLAGLDLYRSGNVALGLDAAVAAVVAFVCALLAIALMLRWLRRATFTPFVVYRLILGAALLIWFV
ncbi:MAG: undecaprenyl-diphosphate phosphatase [Alphaproteobacteria bacterium]|nr:MAG: undecaprenyl-diphosphate phosphatase [Alphaproteobacteria bacterium]